MRHNDRGRQLPTAGLTLLALLKIGAQNLREATVCARGRIQVAGSSDPTSQWFHPKQKSDKKAESIWLTAKGSDAAISNNF